MKSAISNLSNLWQRVIAGVIGATLMIGGIYLNEWTYFVLFGLIMLIAQNEFYQLAYSDGHKPLRLWGLVIGVVLFVLSFLIQSNYLPTSALIILPPVMAIVFLSKLYVIEPKPFTNIAYTFLGVIYVALPFSLMNVAAFSQENGYSYQVVLGTLILLWSSDSGAYFAGSNFGKTKLFERISPKKSWEGFAGGMALALLASYIISLFFNDLPLWQWLVIAVIMVCIGTYGDLVESMLKRSIAIKDSGNLIPGHGGFLDRFDGLLIAAPFVAAFLIIAKWF